MKNAGLIAVISTGPFDLHRRKLSYDSDQRELCVALYALTLRVEAPVEHMSPYSWVFRRSSPDRAAERESLDRGVWR